MSTLHQAIGLLVIGALACFTVGLVRGELGPVLFGIGLAFVVSAILIVRAVF